MYVAIAKTQLVYRRRAMATKPGLLTDWPWKCLGSFKYIILAPWVAQSMYSLSVKGERDYANILIVPFLMWRMLHNQIWITISRHQTAKGNNRIVDKAIEFEQVDREANWDDQILLNGILLYIVNTTVPAASHLPMWRTDGAVITILLHAGPVEFLYYWLHRALHHHYLYSRYHSHHHSSVVTEPITSVIHPFAEHVAYFLLFAIPVLATVFTGTASVMAPFGYITFIDLMNNMGHCNFELIPKSLFTVFPPLKYMIYTPSYHSLHHTQFRTNYSLFMPVYDYIYGTVDKSTDCLYETSLRRGEDSPHVVHLTHLTTPESIYHLRIGFASLASNPLVSKWYLWLMRPLTFWTMIMTWLHGHAFLLERNTFKKLTLQTWAIPRYTIQYHFRWQREAINGLIEEAIAEAEGKGVKVLSLGLLNQGPIALAGRFPVSIDLQSNATILTLVSRFKWQEFLQGKGLNRNGDLYIKRYPQLKIKVVDGSGLAVAIVLNSIPKGTSQVLLRGNLSKIANAIAFALCQRGIQVTTFYENEYEKLKLATNSESRLALSRACAQKVWLVGDGLTDEDQLKASKGTLFIPFSQFAPKKLRKDCFYHYTPAMLAPLSFKNLHACENWLPRRAMSASRIAAIVHALEGWDEHECGDAMLDVDKVWKASLKHGFQPLIIPC